MKLRILITLFVFCLVLNSCSDNSLQLVENGKSNYEIVINEDATESVHASAELLRSYLKKISGVQLNIVTESSQIRL